MECHLEEVKECFQLVSTEVSLVNEDSIDCLSEYEADTRDSPHQGQIQKSNTSETSISSVTLINSCINDETVSFFMVPQLPHKYVLSSTDIKENKIKPCRRNNAAARTVPYCKTNVVKHVRRQSLLPSKCNPRVILYNVVEQGRVNQRYLCNMFSAKKQSQRTHSGTDMAQQGLKQLGTALRSIPVANHTKENNNAQQGLDGAMLKKMGVHTRSGRLSRPPETFTQGNKRPIARGRQEQHHANVTATDTFHAERNTEENKENPEVEKMQVSPTACRKRNIQPQHQCGTCHKIFLGRRMARHLRTHPTHVTVDKLEICQTQTNHPKDVTTSSVSLPTSPMIKDSSPESPRLPAPQLFRLLVQLVTAAETESQQRDVLLTEISQFVGLIRSLVPSLIVPSEQEDNDTVYVDQNVADVLQLNRGKYRFRMDAFGSETVQCEMNSITDVSNVGKTPSYLALSEETVEHEKDAESDNFSFLEEPKTETPSMQSIVEYINGLTELQLQGLLPTLFLPSTDHLEPLDYRAPSPVVPSAPNDIVFIEPVASSSQGTTAFGRPCRLAEELFPSQSHLHALEELTNLSELCSPQVLGVSGGALPNESSVLNFD